MSQRTLSRMQLMDWCDEALPKSQVVYHVGFLFNDRQKGLDHIKIHQTGLTAWALMVEGKVSLLQRLVMPGIWEYIAVKRMKPHERVQWSKCYREERLR